MPQLVTCAMTSHDPLDPYSHIQLGHSAHAISTNNQSAQTFPRNGRFSSIRTHHPIPQAVLNDSKLLKSIGTVRKLLPDVNASTVIELRNDSFRQALQYLADCSDDDIRRLMAPQPRKRAGYPPRLPVSSMEPGTTTRSGSANGGLIHSRGSSTPSTPSTLSPTLWRSSVGVGSDFNIGSLGYSSRPSSMQEFSRLSPYVEPSYSKPEHEQSVGYGDMRLRNNSGFQYDVSQQPDGYGYPATAYQNPFPEPSIPVSDDQTSSHIDAITYPANQPTLMASSAHWPDFDKTATSSKRSTETAYVPESHKIWEESQATASHLSGLESSNRSGSHDPTRRTPQPIATANEQYPIGVLTRPRLRRAKGPIGSQSPTSTRNTQTDHAPGKIPCPDLGCTRQYIVLRELRQHITSEHDHEVQYICRHSDCGKSVFREDRFRHHHTNRHRSCPNAHNSGACELTSRVWQKQNWGCNVCSNAVFREMEMWSSHYANHFQNEHRPDTDRTFSNLINSLLCQASTAATWNMATSNIRPPLQWDESNERCKKLQRVLEEGYYNGSPFEMAGVASDVVRFAISCAKNHSPLNSATKRPATRSPSQSTSSGDTKSRENLFSSSRTGTPGIRPQGRRY